MTRPTHVILNLNALQHNLMRVRQCAPQSYVIAMVKANAYGHGLVPMAQALTTVDAFGVAALQEALLLREAGIKQPIVLMEGVFHGHELEQVLKHNLTLVVHHQVHVAMLEKTLFKTKIAVWLKINTGMNRLGFLPDQFLSAYQRLSLLPCIQKPMGFMTHFALAEMLDHEMTLKQIRLFTHITASLMGPRSLANSAAILARSETHVDWVRPGLMLYGASPFPGRTGIMEQLKPVMTLGSALTAVYPIHPGDVVGYGATWVARKEGRLGIAAIGYGDGYPQRAPSGTPVLVDGIECSLAGRVSMDMLAIDLSQHPAAKIGSRVTLWGEHLPVERIAACCQVSVYELLTQITSRPWVKVIG